MSLEQFEFLHRARDIPGLTEQQRAEMELHDQELEDYLRRIKEALEAL